MAYPDSERQTTNLNIYQHREVILNGHKRNTFENRPHLCGSQDTKIATIYMMTITNDTATAVI